MHQVLTWGLQLFHLDSHTLKCFDASLRSQIIPLNTLTFDLAFAKPFAELNFGPSTYL